MKENWYQAAPMKTKPYKTLFQFLLLLSFTNAFGAVATVTVDELEVPRTYQLDGTVEAVNQSTLAAQTTGQVAEIFYDVEDYVERGDLVITLLDTEHQANLAKAQASLKAAMAQKQDAAKEYQRTREIYDKKLVAKAELDRASAALDTASANEAAARAALDQVKTQLGYTRITAPYSGIVTRRHVEVGEIAQPGQPLISGISLEELRVSVDVPQSMISAVRQYNQAMILCCGNNQWTPPSGELTVFPYAEPGSNTFQVRIGLKREKETLFPGMLVKVAFTVGKSVHLVIPLKTVVYRSEVTGVYVVDESGRVSLRHIRLGDPLSNGKVSVLSGLLPGEQVALDPIAAGTTLKQQRSR